MKKKDILQLEAAIHSNAIRQGWWDKEEPKLLQKRALVVCELAEAIEADRKSKMADCISMQERIDLITSSANGQMTEKRESDIFQVNFIRYVKDTVEDELADAIIRIIDLLMYEEKEYVEDSVLAPCYSIEALLFEVAKYVHYGLYTDAINSIVIYCHFRENKYPSTHRVEDEV